MLGRMPPGVVFWTYDPSLRVDGCHRMTGTLRAGAKTTGAEAWTESRVAAVLSAAEVDGTQRGIAPEDIRAPVAEVNPAHRQFFHPHALLDLPRDPPPILIHDRRT